MFGNKGEGVLVADMNLKQYSVLPVIAMHFRYGMVVHVYPNVQSVTALF